jgi:hypothetical protein
MQRNPFVRFFWVSNYIFSATRSLALCAREFILSSSLDDVIGFLDMIFTDGFLPQMHTGKSLGQVQGFAREAKVCFVMRSSSEWKVITARRPP